MTWSPQGRFEEGAALLNGRVMTEARSVGKHMFLKFDAPPALERAGIQPLWLRVHLGLYGAWRFHAAPEVEVEASIGAPRTPAGPYLGEDTGVRAPRPGDIPGRRENEGFTVQPSEDPVEGEWAPPEPIGAVRLRIDNGKVVADLTGPAACEVLTAEEVQLVADRLGPDPLDERSDPEALKEAFVTGVRGSKRSIGELLMDQSVIAGVGNIYRAEGLFRQRISPNRKGVNVSERRLGALWDDYVELLHRGVTEGRITTVEDQDKPDAEWAAAEDPESQRWYVYHRSGRECLVCGETVQEKEVQNRRLFWCSNCQR